MGKKRAETDPEMKGREWWVESERAAQQDGEKKAKRPLEDLFLKEGRAEGKKRRK